MPKVQDKIMVRLTFFPWYGWMEGVGRELKTRGRGNTTDQQNPEGEYRWNVTWAIRERARFMWKICSLRHNTCFLSFHKSGRWY